MQRKIKDNKKVLFDILICILLFFLYLLCFTRYVNNYWFDTDELDIYAAGEALAKGFRLYKDFVSQHMPVSYIISSVFWIIGAKTVPLQRFCFYIFFSFFFSLFYYRYQNYCNKRILAIFPLFFIFVLCTYDYGSCILSEYLVGIGYIILLLEYYKFLKSDSLTFSSCIFLSISILLTLGTTFVAAYGIMAIVVCVIIVEVKKQIKEKKNFKEFIQYLFQKYRMLVVTCIIPWICLIIYFITEGTLSDCFYWVYKFNRTIYSNYLTDGYGTNVLAPFYCGIFYIKDYFLEFYNKVILVTDFHFSNVIQFFITISSFVYFIYLMIKKKVLEGLSGLLLILEASSRGFWNFHSTQVICVMCFGTAGFINEIILTRKLKFNRIPLTILMVNCMTLIVCSLPYFLRVEANYNIFEVMENNNVEIVKLITEEDEAIWDLEIATNYISIYADRAEIHQFANVPWVWDYFKDCYLDELNENPPRVLIFNYDMEIWSRKIKEYAPELCQYVFSNYTCYIDDIYIRNDYYQEASNILVNNGY